MDLSTVTEMLAGDSVAPGKLEPGDAWLAGGTWLFSQPQPQLRRLLDLSAFGWEPLVADDQGLQISATCTLAELAHWQAPAQWLAAPLIGECCRALLGSFKVWNAATVGGNICLSLPAGPMTSLSASLDGVCTIWNAGGEVSAVPIVDFVLGAGRNVLKPGALLRSIFLPVSALRTHTAFRQLSLSVLGRSAAVVIGRLSPDDGTVVVTISASVERPVQLRFAAMPTASELAEALEQAPLVYHDDVHGHPLWREHLTHMFAAEVCAELAAKGALA